MKTLLTNWREILLTLILIPLMLFCMALLGSVPVAESSGLGNLVSIVVSLLGGVLKFAVCLALAWVGMAITFPEANRFIVSVEFDGWWARVPGHVRGYVSLGAVAVLALVAALCMAS